MHESSKIFIEYALHVARIQSRSKPNMPDLAAILVFHGTAGSIITIGFVTKRTLALEKPV